MPDLDAMAVEAWVQERDPEAHSLPVIGPVDRDPEALQHLLRLGHLLDQRLANDADRLALLLAHTATAMDLQAALTQVGVARRMRLLAWFSDEGLPERDKLLTRLAATGSAGGFIRAELEALHRRALLARIFAPERIRMLLEASQPKDRTEVSG